MKGHFEVAMLLLDRGAVVKKDNIVSDITREIVVIVCVIDCVIKLCRSTVVFFLRPEIIVSMHIDIDVS